MDRIGSAIGRRAKGFEMRVIYHNRGKSPYEEEVGATMVDFERLLQGEEPINRAV